MLAHWRRNVDSGIVQSDWTDPAIDHRALHIEGCGARDDQLKVILILARICGVSRVEWD